MASVQDIAGAWKKFCGHHDGQVINVAGQWQVWCVRGAKRERTERERAGGTYRRSPEFSEPSNAEKGRAERLAREAAHREEGGDSMGMAEARRRSSTSGFPVTIWISRRRFSPRSCATRTPCRR